MKKTLSTMVKQANNKKACIKDGELIEEALKQILKEDGLNFKHDTYLRMCNMDLALEDISIEVKKLSTPFRMANKFVGLEPEEALTINPNPLKRYYKQNPNGFIFLVVDYRPEFDTFGIYVIKVKEAHSIMKSKPKRSRLYKKRPDGNNKDAFYVSTKECKRLDSEIFFRLIRRYNELRE